MKEMKALHSIEEIPDFATEEEEAEFWAHHTFSADLLERMRRVQNALLGELFAEWAQEEKGAQNRNLR